MAEIKNNFFQGKMNKDLDERLVPNGQYRDALNIEVSTSESDDVGTVQSVKGNTLVSGDIVPTGSSIVGEITDEKNNCIYYFVAGPHTERSSFSSSDTQPTISKDLILKYDGTSITNVFTDVYSYLAVFDTGATDLSFDVSAQTITVPNTSAYTQVMARNMYANVFDTSGTEYVRNNRITSVAGAVLTLENKIDDLDGVAITNLILEITYEENKRPLNFNSEYPVTGINIVEDFLMWTDNNSEPKKISISRSINGTLTGDNGRRKPTKLYIDGSSSYPLTTGKRADETHTTVIRKSPINSPNINIKDTRTNTIDKSTNTLDMSGVNQDGFLEIEMSGAGENPFLPNDILHLKASPGVATEEDFDVRVKVIELIGTTRFKAKVISPTNLTGSSTFSIFLLRNKKELFKDKFSFFATRFKYVDGEYSTFSPFSNAAFLPSNFTYDTKEAFNAGMVNNLEEIEITDIIPENIPEDVVQVDILYTESNSPEIYKVDSVRRDSTNDTYWNDNKYIISEENIYSLLEEKQLLRQWDNVPKKALAQEIVGNRLVYANYEQSYDLDNQNIELEAYVDDRIFTGPELLPNKYLSEHFDGYTTSPVIPSSAPQAFTHIKSVNNKEAGFISVNGTLSNLRFHKIHTESSLNLESDAEYYYSFKISNWSQVPGISAVLEGPALMSGDNVTGKYGDFAQQITGDGYYYGTMSIDLDRSTSVSIFNNAAVRDFMFQIKNLGFTCDISHFSLKKVLLSNRESVKSMRNYKLGVVYADEYGRETPVLTGKSASLSVPKLDANSINCIKSKITSNPPDWATHFKYFIKETSSEYNNIALDRIYKSGDDGYWLSFPSTERNKVDEDTFLILKKSHNDSIAVLDEEATYKILDVSNNAPDFIKINKNSVGLGGITADINNNLFEDPSSRPVVGESTISFNKDAWITSEGNPDLSELITQKDLVFQFEDSNNLVSELYNIDSLQVVNNSFTSNDHYVITIEGTFSDGDVGTDGFVMDGANLASTVKIEVFSKKIENKPEFDGRFFVKVFKDDFITTNVYNNSTNSISNQIVANVPSFFKQDSVTSGYSVLSNTNIINGKIYLACLKENYSITFTSGGSINTTEFNQGNSYAVSQLASNVIDINDANYNSATVSAWDDLTSSAFRTYSSTGPFSTNFVANDTLYYEARSWYASGDDRNSPDPGAHSLDDDQKNIYKAISASTVAATLHLEGIVNIDDLGVGIENNVVGVDQTTSIGNSGQRPGVLKHAAFSYSYGLFQSQGSNNFSVYGSQGAYMKFLRLFKYGVAGADNDLSLTGDYSSRWFIDNTSYIGVQRDASYNPEVDGHYTLYHRAVHYEFTNGNILEMAANDGFGFGGNPTGGKNDFNRVGRGIYTATDQDRDADLYLYGSGFRTTGDFCMELSYGGMETDIPHVALSSGNVSAVTTSLQANGWTSSNSDFLSIVNNIEVGAKFKFVNDPNAEEYTILDFKVVKRYNHTPFPGDSFTHHQYFPDNAGSHSAGIAGTIQNISWGDLRDTSSDEIKRFRARTTHNSSDNFDLRYIGSNANGASGSAATIVQDSIADEEKRFLRGSNRRLTYILKLDKLPGVSGSFDPRNISASTTNSEKMDGRTSRIIQFIGSVVNEETQLTTDNPAVFETEPKTTEGLDIYYEASDFYDIKDHGVVQDLKYFNCYSFENGVESNRIKDVFNKPNVGKGIVASTTIDEVYKKDRRGSGLIFSGIYNSTSNVNNLNQFIQAEKITKDVNPTYGTIQKLHTKDSNLLVLCEDKVLKILANKDAVFNADGNPQLTANKNVLGQTIPYAGEFGISKDPRSFASQSHRSYFTDKQRGAVLRLSMDGLTPVSQYGMADFFRDNLPISTSLIGSYDTRKNEYNLKIDTSGTDYVISFNENIKGFSSFKSFTDMQAGISFNNNYYTFKDGELYKHHSNDSRCTFYGDTFKSGNSLEAYVEVIFNTNPYENKRFKTILYEGSQGKVDILDVTSDGSDADVYNIETKAGWFAETIVTPTQSGSINEFLEKDSRWYNYIKGDAVTASNIDTSDFNVQGLGVISSNTAS